MNTSRKIAIMQPYFFPYLGYFQLIHAVDKFILYDELNFIKDAWMNRNRIMVKNQAPAHISVPLEKKSSYKKIKDIKIANIEWKKGILNSIHLNYRKAAFFDEIYSPLEKLLEMDHQTLSSLNYNSTQMIVQNLGIDTTLSAYPTYADLESKLMQENFMDNFPEYQLENAEKKVVRVLEIAKYEKAGIFINPIGGQELYSKKEFLANGLELFFIKMDTISYTQFSKKFEASLSIIDVLMHNGWIGTKNLLDSYKLV